MCGIFGVLYRDRETLPEADRIKASVDSISHRGPDSDGFFATVGVALGHTRLSLLDLSDRGRQPMWDPHDRYCLVYNGEIYNFLGLKQSLESRGCRFQTTTDTEVLLQSLIVDGIDDTLARIEGMFAFAFYDKAAGTLLLVRDRFGIKPLFVYEDDTKLVFASEIKAMRPWVDLAPNASQITSSLLGFGGPTRGSCFYQGVRIIEPGGKVTAAPRERAIYERYFRVTDLIDVEETARLDTLPSEKMVDELADLLERSVKLMLFADAPVGALCSGGVDSSVLMAIAARHHDNLAIFHADVLGPGSEYTAARELSRHLGLDLKKIDVVDQDFIDELPRVMHHYGHPFDYHPNSVPFYMVARLVREWGVKAVLSGEGADECFLGYPWIAQEPFLQAYAKAIGRAKALVRRIPMIGKYMSAGDSPGDQAMVSMLNGFERELEIQQIDTDWTRMTKTKPTLNTRTLHWLSYHLRTTLHRNDALGMAASIEARFPYLDETVTRAAVNLPHRAKIRFSPRTWERSHPLLRDKWVLRKVADRYLPKALSRRKKLGFPVNAYDRLRISNSYFNSSFVTDLYGMSGQVVEHLMDASTQDEKVKLLLLDVWGEVCVREKGQDEMLSKLRRHLTIEKI